MTELRYITWDYDNNVAIEFEREGECNGCGECCMTVIRFHVENASESKQGGRATDQQGVWHEISRGTVRRFFKFDPVDTSIVSHCSMLTYDTHRCLLHERGKKLIQSGWPFCLENVTPFKKCSYSFHEVGRWEIQ